ncbi:hypothetical protein CDD82_7744 [Ophiocordyceps australis]|uniref:Uncharacterized protein n=1 Tax=Ophiocordyceps australis TaxID=1399860 RepID=A0A2C5YP11_9HYPO|nr:hypothetical protein CDD82_7744 [Ophiocordyceps australis]
MLRCDVRPIISDGHDKIVDGYAEPQRCGCAPDEQRKPRLQCLEHGCCRAATKTHLCADPDSCGDTISFHVYRQASQWPTRQRMRLAATLRATMATSNIMIGVHDGNGPDDDDGSDAGRQARRLQKWATRRALDGELFQTGHGQRPGTRLRFEAPALRAALHELRRLGRRIALLEGVEERWGGDLHLFEDEPETRTLLGAALLLSLGERSGLVERFAVERGKLLGLERWGERAVTY